MGVGIAFHHEPRADEDEGDAQNLTHIEGQTGLEGLLNLLGVLDEEAEGEDEEEAEAEEEARAHTVRTPTVEHPAEHEVDSVGDGLVELAGVARHLVDALEDEGPGHVGHLADDLRVHQIAQTDEARRGAGGDGDVVEHRPQGNLLPAHVEQQSQDEAQRAAVRGQALVARHLPPAVGQEVYGQQHLDEAPPRRQEVVGLVEDAVPQACTYQDAQEAVDEQRLKLLVADLLFLVQSPHDEVRQCQAYEPAQRVPPESPRADVKRLKVRVPHDITQ